ncbi:MAG: NAD(P)-dependent dehydrogenase (short-subunit alcohol dehydrogenase family) [Paracoccaceae bacterium]|mgnify:CR=1 FL=1|jgi:NAD(P)-dependent dehydrogenase (short-subunit alcohol dehydrogenase family)
MTKIALITGASRGLGAALAEALAGSHHIIAVARTVGALEELDDRIKSAGGEATLAPMDITDAGAMQHLCKSIHERWGGIDLWAHCAIHAAPLAPAQFVDAKDWQKSVDVNITAPQRLITYVHTLLEARPGAQALFFDDPRAGQKFFGAYGATKAAQIAIARSWQAETVNTGPRVHIQTPSPMPTATRARFFPGEDRTKLGTPAAQAHHILSTLT